MKSTFGLFYISTLRLRMAHRARIPPNWVRVSPQRRHSHASAARGPSVPGETASRVRQYASPGSVGDWVGLLPRIQPEPADSLFAPSLLSPYSPTHFLNRVPQSYTVPNFTHAEGIRPSLARPHAHGMRAHAESNDESHQVDIPVIS